MDTIVDVKLMMLVADVMVKMESSIFLQVNKKWSCDEDGVHISTKWLPVPRYFDENTPKDALEKTGNCANYAQFKTMTEQTRVT